MCRTNSVKTRPSVKSIWDCDVFQANSDMKKTAARKRPDLSHWAVAEYVPALVTCLYNKTATNTSRLYRKRFGVGLADWRIIAYLGNHGSGKSAQICEFIGLDKAAVSRSISRLKAQGYVVTKPRNGRDIGVSLTPKGLKIGNRILAVALEIEKELMHGIDSAARHVLVKTLKIMLVNLPRIKSLIDE